MPEARGDTGERAYRRLHEAIVHNTIAPGARLVETALCEWLQVSRTPVREALRRLKTDGLVETGPAGGLRVARFDVAALAELYVVREVLEATAASEAARNASRTELGALEDSMRIQRGLKQDVPGFARENVVFHQHLYAASHNRFLVRTLQALSDSLALLGQTTLDNPAAIERAIAQHAKIVAAVAKRDPERAFEATRAHIHTGFETRAAAFRRRPPEPREE